MMKNTVYYQEKGAIRLFLENLLVGFGSILLVVAGIILLMVVCKLAFAAFMLLPDEIRNPIICVSLIALVSVIFWKLKEIITMFALIDALFS